MCCAAKCRIFLKGAKSRNSALDKAAFARYNYSI